MERSRRRGGALAVSLAAAIVPPLAVFLWLFVPYASAYDGSCYSVSIVGMSRIGSPCSRFEYLSRFFPGELGVNAVLVGGTVAASTVVFVLGWLIALGLGARRARGRGEPGG